MMKTRLNPNHNDMMINSGNYQSTKNGTINRETAAKSGANSKNQTGSFPS